MPRHTRRTYSRAERIEKCKRISSSEARMGALDSVLGYANFAWQSVSSVKDFVPGLGAVFGGISVVTSLVKGFGGLASESLDSSGIAFDEIKELINQKFNEVNRKLDENAKVLREVSKMVNQTLTLVEQTRKEMQEGFKRVIDSIENGRIKEIVTIINNFVENAQKYETSKQSLSKENYKGFIEQEIEQLQKNIDPDGILYTQLFTIIHNEYAIPKNVNHNTAYQALLALFFGTETYVSIFFSLIDHHVYLANFYYDKEHFEKFNEHFERVKYYFRKFRTVLIDNDRGLLNEVLKVLQQSSESDYIRYLKKESFENIVKGTETLNSLRYKVNEKRLPLLTDISGNNNILISFKSKIINPPILRWQKGVTVRYAVQYETNGNFSKVSDWSEPIQVHSFAYPDLMLDFSDNNIIFDTTRVFRKFNDEKPELVGVGVLKRNTPFRDINRDFYNLAKSISFDAETMGNISDILLDNGADISAKFRKGKTAIHTAATHGNSFMIDKILNRDANLINLKDEDGYTPLHLASKWGETDVVEQLVTKGADVNVLTNLHFSPLHFAVKSQSEPIVKYLLTTEKTDVNLKDKNGFTPLHIAVSESIFEKSIAELLLNNTKIDINAKTELGLTPLHCASYLNLQEFVKVLLLHEKVNINEKDNNNLTPLHYAIVEGNLDIVKLLLSETDIDVNAITSEKMWSPLHFSLWFDKPDIVTELIKNDNIDVNIADVNSTQPIHMAAARGQKELVKHFIEMGSEINRKTSEGFTPLHFALKSNATEVSKLLINKGADVNAETNSGAEPLHFAALSGNSEIVKELRKKDANLKAKDNDGKLPFHDAIRSGNLDLVRRLLKVNPEFLKESDYYGHIPLYFALENPKTGEMYNYLVSQGADVKNELNEPLLHTVTADGNLKAVEFLINQGVDTEYEYEFQTFFDVAVEKGWVDIISHVTSNNITVLDTFRENETHSTRQTTMCKAVDVHQFRVLEYLDLPDLDISYCTPLHYAAGNGDLDIVIYLVSKNKSDVHQINRSTPLCIAISGGHFEVFKFLQSKTEDIGKICSAPPEQLTPIHLAIGESVTDSIVRYLVKERIGADGIDETGNAPLHYAARYNKYNFTQYLVENLNADIEIRNHENLTPLHVAADYDNLEIFTYLVDKKANLSSKIDEKRNLCDIAKDQVLEYLKQHKVCSKTLRHRKDKGSENDEYLGNVKDNISHQRLKTVEGDLRQNGAMNNIGIKTDFYRSNRDDNLGNSLVLKDLKANINDKKYRNIAMFDVNSFLLMLDLVIRHFTNQKYGFLFDTTQSLLEKRALALNISSNIEKLIKATDKTESHDETDFLKLHSEIYKAILSENRQKLQEILCSFLTTHSGIEPYKDKNLSRWYKPTENKMKFLNIYNKELQDILTLVCIKNI